MSDKIVVDKDMGLIILYPVNAVTSDNVIESMKKVCSLSESTGIMSLLVDAREIDSMPSIVDVFELTCDFPRNLKIAVLLPGKDDPAEKLQFGENVGYNRGIPVRLFKSKSDAVEWLKS
jgi:hypothetical protein